jgi:hypothetical protein
MCKEKNCGGKSSPDGEGIPIVLRVWYKGEELGVRSQELGGRRKEVFRLVFYSAF